MSSGPTESSRDGAPLCIYCWPVIAVAVCEHNGHPCCGSALCLAAKEPALPGFMLKPRSVSLFDEQP